MHIELNDAEAVFLLDRTRLVARTFKLMNRQRELNRLPSIYAADIAMLEGLASKLALVVDTIPAPPSAPRFVTSERERDRSTTTLYDPAESDYNPAESDLER